MAKPVFATFWHGAQLSPYELACLSSFPKRGYEIAVYFYERPANLPDWVTPKDAHDILAPESLLAFSVKGKPSLAHFSDHFRYALFLKTDYIWVDTDIVLMNDFTLDPTKNIMGLEEKGSINTAVLHLDRSDARSLKMVRKVQEMAGKPIKWGDTGPNLLSKLYKVSEALPESAFYPIHYNDFYKVFLPEFRDECMQACEGAFTLHLWNHIIADMGVYNRVGPPIGSYLHALFEDIGALGFFPDFYPLQVMKNLVHNAIERPGDDAGFKRIFLLLGPALKLSIARHLGKAKV